MAIMNPKTAFEKEQIQRFGGINTNERVSKASAAEVKNFRILTDGSLEKRSGYVGIRGGITEPRGFWEGEIDGQYYAFVVSGNRVLYTVDSCAELTDASVLSTSSGPVSFAYYNDALYLFDGARILRFFQSTRSFDSPGIFTNYTIYVQFILHNKC